VPTLARADELDLAEISRGVVEASQCDGGGRMMAANYLGTISDGIANLFLQDWGKGGSDPQKRRIGGAALEYRLLYHRPCTVGTLLVVRSCMVDVGEKTVRHSHWMFDAETGEGIASAQAVAVFIDMEERRAIAVPEEARRHFQSLLRPELAR
jgi:acyl-CoA thioester hydrolase